MKKQKKQINITKMVNLKGINKELGFSINYLKRRSDDSKLYFPEWLKPEMQRLNDIMENWIEDVKRYKHERKLKPQKSTNMTIEEYEDKRKKFLEALKGYKYERKLKT